VIARKKAFRGRVDSFYYSKVPLFAIFRTEEPGEFLITLNNEDLPSDIGLITVVSELETSEIGK
jgi:hypothetical protein